VPKAAHKKYARAKPPQSRKARATKKKRRLHAWRQSKQA